MVNKQAVFGFVEKSPLVKPQLITSSYDYLTWAESKGEVSSKLASSVSWLRKRVKENNLFYGADLSVDDIKELIKLLA